MGVAVTGALPLLSERAAGLLRSSAQEPQGFAYPNAWRVL